MFKALMGLFTSRDPRMSKWSILWFYLSKIQGGYINLRVAQMVNNLPGLQETRFQFLGWEDPLEKGMAIYSTILAWRNPWTEEPGWLQSKMLQKVR